MLKDKSSAAIVAVTDMGRARKFYGETLGLDVENVTDDVATFRTGNTSLVVYQSEFAGSNKANAAVWGVGDEIDAITEDLKSRASPSNTMKWTASPWKATSMLLAISGWSGSGSGWQHPPLEQYVDRGRYSAGLENRAEAAIPSQPRIIALPPIGADIGNSALPDQSR